VDRLCVFAAVAACAAAACNGAEAGIGNADDAAAVAVTAPEETPLRTVDSLLAAIMDWRTFRSGRIKIIYT